RRCRRAAGTRRAHGGCGRALRCSSSTMCRIASFSRLDLASQAPCARPMLLLGQAPSAPITMNMLRQAPYAVLLVVVAAQTAWAQQPEGAAPTGSVEPVTVLASHGTERFWLSGQVNFIFQMHPDFHAPYSGDHSLGATSERALSRVMTLFTGV